jgi:IS5 family transposase
VARRKSGAPFDSVPSRARLMRKLLKKQMRPLRVMMKIDRNMDVRHAKTADVRRLIRQCLLVRVQP